MERLLERCAGLDLHKDIIAACVRVPGEGSGRSVHQYEFGTTTQELLGLRDWLGSHGVTVVGMEATGTSTALRARSAATGSLFFLEGPQGEGLKIGDELVEFSGVVEPGLVAGELVLADLTSYGLAIRCPSPAEVGPVQHRLVPLAVATCFAASGGAPHEATR